MPVETWLAYATLNFLFDITPGPAVALTVGQAASRGFRSGLTVAVGVEIGNVAYLTLSALGLGVFIAQSDAAFRLIQYAGCAYLLVLGILAIRSASRDRQGPQRVALWQRPVLQGTANQLANPKSILFYMALLPQFIDAQRPLAPQLLILAITGIAIEVPVLAVYAAAAAAGGSLLSRRAARGTEYASGIALLFAAGALMLVKKTP